MGVDLSKFLDLSTLRTPNHAQRVINAHGEALRCCWTDCERDGDNRYRIEVPHSQPKFPGEMLVYIFCSQGHQALQMQGTPWEDRA